jgi:hypothetical protein
LPTLVLGYFVAVGSLTPFFSSSFLPFSTGFAVVFGFSAGFSGSFNPSFLASAAPIT